MAKFNARVQAKNKRQVMVVIRPLDTLIRKILCKALPVVKKIRFSKLEADCRKRFERAYQYCVITLRTWGGARLWCSVDQNLLRFQNYLMSVTKGNVTIYVWELFRARLTECLALRSLIESFKSGSRETLVPGTWC